MIHYGELRKSREAVVQVARASFRGRDRLDIRTYLETRPGDADTRVPTQRGVSIPLSDLPELLMALLHASSAAFWDGSIDPAAYTAAGLPVPPPPDHFK